MNAREQGCKRRLGDHAANEKGRQMNALRTNSDDVRHSSPMQHAEFNRDRKDQAPQRGGDFLDLLQRHRSQLFGYILSLVNNLSDSEDLFQQTSLVLWQNFSKFEPGTDFTSWACSFARFNVLNFLRQRRRHRVQFSEEFLLELSEEPRDCHKIIEERRAALAGCMNKLPPTDRRLVERCYRGDLSIKQVAEHTHRSVQATYNALSRIRRVLFECIEQTLMTEANQ